MRDRCLIAEEVRDEIWSKEVESQMDDVHELSLWHGVSKAFHLSGHRRLGRSMTLLMAFCDYVGKSIKDAVSAPRPSFPPVRRVTATEEEEDISSYYSSV
ncbi:hypothetical protein KSP39_PZI001142 [Platanthera zijinensis]|uniref:Uncharacterized protein n=1 Tax=Platanthera zijinensis TaxID=2320716 RepID=A0AAP0GG62_9ASPA